MKLIKQNKIMNNKQSYSARKTIQGKTNKIKVWALSNSLDSLPKNKQTN